MPKKKAPKARILVIDDDEFLAGIYILTLEKASYEVILSDNGLTGIKEAKKHQPDLIILDILMPGLDGFQVLRQLKQNRTTTHIPVVLLTTLTNKEDEELGLAQGAEAFMTKSTTLPVDMVNQLETVLKKQHQTNH